MSYPPNDDLKRAIDALTLFQVWAAAYREGAVLEAPPATERDGQFKSPFRDDGKSGSFSVCHQGRGFKDFGGNGEKGGVWAFAGKCWPDLLASKKELAKRLIELSGIPPTVPAPRPPAGAAGAVDPALEQAAKTLERNRRIRAQEDAIYEERDKVLKVPQAKPVPAWPLCVRRHYVEGLDDLTADRARITKLAAERGWPVEFADGLVALGLVAYPLERWSVAGDKWAKRQKAFLVQAPRLGRTGSTALDSVGYHQRFYQPAANGRPENKGWVYVPSLPKHEPRSPLEHELVAYAAALGIAKGEPLRLPPLPFVLGDVETPKTIVILEGQWDAATFFGACGYFHDMAPASTGLTVFGIRGVQGIDAFLGHWGEWLRFHKPRAWVIADNDAAGGSWRDAPRAQPGLPQMPSLADRLVAAGCAGGTRAPLVSWLKPGPWGKDFNDYYKARAAAGAAITPEKMRDWMRKTGIITASGGWA